MFCSALPNKGLGWEACLVLDLFHRWVARGPFLKKDQPNNYFLLFLRINGAIRVRYLDREDKKCDG